MPLLSSVNGFFYRAMHYSAKRGIAIACCPSVCLSVYLSVRLLVTLVDCHHIGWKSGKRSPKDIHLLQEEHGEILGRLEVGWEKWRSGAQKRQ